MVFTCVTGVGIISTSHIHWITDENFSPHVALRERYSRLNVLVSHLALFGLRGGQYDNVKCYGALIIRGMLYSVVY